MIPRTVSLGKGQKQHGEALRSGKSGDEKSRFGASPSVRNGEPRVHTLPSELFLGFSRLFFGHPFTLDGLNWLPFFVLGHFQQKEKRRRRMTTRQFHFRPDRRFSSTFVCTKTRLPRIFPRLRGAILRKYTTHKYAVYQTLYVPT